MGARGVRVVNGPARTDALGARVRTGHPAHGRAGRPIVHHTPVTGVMGVVTGVWWFAWWRSAPGWAIGPGRVIGPGRAIGLGRAVGLG